MKRILLILTLALVALAGCKKDPAPAPGPEQGSTPDTLTTIVFKTSKAVGETITLGFRRSEMQNISMDGAKPESGLPAGDWGIYTCKLSSQTVTIKGDITLFDCKNNGITEIVLTKDLKLFDFNCSGNELTSLDVSGLTELEILVCSSNKLTSLNIEGCENLYYLECYNNSIKDEAMTDVVNDLPTLGAPGAGRFVVTAEGCGNVITEDDIDIAVDKNWDVVDDKYNSLSQEPTPIVKVSEISISMSKYEVSVGYMVRATATVSPEDAENREVTWSSSNTAIAIVRVVDLKNNAADVIGVSPGRVIITATAKDGSGVTASVPVTVIPDKTTFASPANCYIVTTADTYAFKAVKGNSSESVGNVASVEVLWESFGTHNTPQVGELVKNVSYSNGEITFTATHMKGNAVIAAKDALGEILWSWHIWLTDQPQEQEFYNNAGVMMDRNLGATSATPGYVGSLGLLYQWGRKDPFLASSSISSPVEAKSTITWPEPVLSDSSTGKIYYTIANPTTFIYVNYLNNKNNDWYYTGSSSTDDTRWTPSNKAKSIYDPCPAGWRVPDGGENGVWSKALGSSSDFRNDSLFDKIDKGMNLQGRLGSNQKIIWYPASGCRYYTDGDLYVGDYGSCWSASPYNHSAYSMDISADGAVRPSDSSSRAYGLSVRCIKE